MTTTTLTNWISAHTVLVTVGAVCVLAVGVAARHAWRAVKGRASLADVITVAVALCATVYAGAGSWHYLDKAMGYGPALRAVLVSVFEGAVIAEGLRSRRSIAEHGTAGADGIGLWVLTGISALLSASESASAKEAAGRLAVPVVAAWLWERLLAPQRLARREARTPRVIRWRITGERIAVWLRLADAAEASVSQVEANRKVVRFLKATDREARDGRRWPLSATARAERARTKLAAHALLHYGDPAAAHAALAGRMLAEALTRLGITAQPNQSDEVNTDTGIGGTLTDSGQVSAINTPVLTLPSVPALAMGPRPDTTEAEQIIRYGWESGLGVRETARAADRDPGQVSRTFARLEATHGSRPGMAAANGEQVSRL